MKEKFLAPFTFSFLRNEIHNVVVFWENNWLKSSGSYDWDMIEWLYNWQTQIHLPTKLVLSASCVASSWLSPVVRAAQPNQEKKEDQWIMIGLDYFVQ